jgi:LuxR family maltose regulon positive regulatory protein
MPKASEYLLAWHAMSGVYELREHHNERLIPVTADERAWFAWLDSVLSFTFHGRCGQLTVRKESRPHGGSYWYAYRRIGKKMTKKYLGRTTELTLARLEEAAAALTKIETLLLFSPEASTKVLSNEHLVRKAKDDAEALVLGVNTRSMPSSSQNVQHDLMLEAKLHRPRPRSRLVSRSRLVERIQQGMENAVVLVSAPAGFGKTTLLSQWLAESSLPVAWLSLEQEDNDPVRFLTYLIAALQTINANLGTTALELLHTPQPPPPESVMVLLTNDLLHTQEEDVALVLDDYHLIIAEPIHNALTYLVEHLPPQLHLVIVTRADPPLPLSRFRARGQLTEVRETDLRFSSVEASLFLRVVMGLDVLPEHVAALERRTEGWIAGLQLAALALQGRTDISIFLSGFTGSHRFVLDYLCEEVLLQQPLLVQTFLLHTSILESLSGSLCDAVTKQNGSHSMLEALDRANLFVIPLDDERQWYRYHHLFAEVLRNRIEQGESLLLPELHRRASTWYEIHGFVVEAVQHALAAPDLDRAASLVEQHGVEILFGGQYYTLLNWMDTLPELLVRTRPLLSLIYAALLIFLRQFDKVENLLNDAEVSIDDDTPTELARLIKGWTAQCRAELANYSSTDIPASIVHARRALSLLPETEETVHIRASAYYYVARSVQLSGDVTPSTERLIIAAVELASAGGLAGRSRGVSLLTFLRAIQGRLSEAIAVYERERVIVEELGTVGGNAFHFFNYGNLLREMNELKASQRILVTGMDSLGEMVQPDNGGMLLGYVAQARLEQALGERERALSTMDAFMQLARERNYASFLVASGAAVRAQLELMQGSVEAARRWANNCGLSAYDAELGYPREQEYLILARVLIAQGRNDRAEPFLQDAMYLLDRLLADAEAKARMGSVLEILIVRSLALFTQGDQQRALTTLERALTLAGPEGYVRLFVDEGLPMLTLLHQVQARGILPDYVTVLLSAFGEQHASYTAPAAPANAVLIEPLTEREREVLSWLSAGASNREIAGRLVVSVNTVKRHVYNICSKFGVQSRTQAIARARTLHLI